VADDFGGSGQYVARMFAAEAAVWWQADYFFDNHWIVERRMNSQRM
jgi:hypothetical protein